MSIHLHEISESVLLIRRRTATGLVKNKSQTAAGMADAAVVIEGDYLTTNTGVLA